MNRSDYYAALKALARDTRAKHGLETPRVMRSDLRRILRDQGVAVDLWPYPLKTLRGAYFRSESGSSIMVAKSLPNEPAIFTMAHELKHHLVDREAVVYCATGNVDEVVEIGAEVFAAELIYPEAMFFEDLGAIGVNRDNFRPDDLIRLKRKTDTTMSYQALVKRAEFHGFAAIGSMKKVKWKKREEEIYGEPVYRRVLRARRAKAAGP